MPPKLIQIGNFKVDPIVLEKILQYNPTLEKQIQRKILQTKAVLERDKLQAIQDEREIKALEKQLTGAKPKGVIKQSKMKK